MEKDLPEKTMTKKSYSGHHQRLRDRFVKSGFDGFHDYEVLELLLNYIFPNRDTKPIARALLQRFKSLSGVFKAEVKELQEVKGVGERTVVFLKTFYEAFSFIADQEAKSEKTVFDSTAKFVEYFGATIGNMKNEIMRAIYLNSQNQLIHAENLSEGTVAEAVAFPRKIVEGALKYNAVSVVIAHNHPGGVPEPSDNDDTMTEQIKNALKTININLQDHLVIAGNGYFSYRQTGYLE